ncbi:MAG: hypothetical protein HXY50_07530 [Ignavibacteriaceae bacterium]|nr:hypothetical protein [Ignavibacteriaceae bacterium]
MKKYVIILALFGLYFLGCSDQPTVSYEPAASEVMYKLIELPAPLNLKLNTVYTVSKVINGSTGGTITIQDNYAGGPYGNVTKNITLTFPSGSFSGTKTITLSVDDYYCVADFSPSMTFLMPVVANVTYTGINLYGIDPAKIKFVYLKDDGSIEYLTNDGVTIDLATGTLKVKNVKLNHFSRYGFINVEGE